MLSHPDDSTPPAPNHDRHPTARGWISLLQLSVPKRLASFLICLTASGVAAWSIPESMELNPAARRSLFILLFAASLWISDAIPAFAVGILVIGLQIALLGKPGDVFATSDQDWEAFAQVIGDPLVWLFFGGFVLSAGLSRATLDRWLAAQMLRRLGHRPESLLAGIMATAFGLSMFMSNTATTAMIVAMLAPMLIGRPPEDRLAKGLLLAVAVAANVGGMASLIGTPPNAVAVGALRNLAEATEISFLGWLTVGLPPALILITLSYWVIRVWFFGRLDDWQPIELPQVDTASSRSVATWQKSVVATTALLTVGLWMTGQWHGLPTPVVSFLPIVVFTSVGILRENEIRGLPYDVLFLLAGGLALGRAVTDTGLSTWLVERLPLEGLSPVALTLLVAYTTVLLSNFMSNTAAANVLVPIGITIASGFEAELAVTIALCASTAMCLPVATPPNAMVFATARVNTTDFLKMGLLLGCLGPVIATFWTGWMFS